MTTHFRKTPIALAAAMAAVALYGCESYAGNEGNDSGMSQIEETAAGVSSAVGRTGQSLDDAAISGTIKTKLIDNESLDADAINVDTAGGVVTLTGMVPSTDAKALATKVAAEVSGVVSVDNRLTIGDEPSLMQKAAGTVDDVAITAKVKAKLIGEDSLSAAGINVDTADNIVTLSGSVASAHDKDLAEDIASKVPGVESVDNRLQVKSGS